MKLLSMREAADELGVSIMTLYRHAERGQIKVPKVQKVGGIEMRLWSAQDIARVRKQLGAVRRGRPKKRKA